MGHAIRQTALIDGADAVSPTDHADAVRCRNGLCQRHRAGREWRHFEAPHGAIPDDRFSRVYGFDELVDGGGTNVERHPAILNPLFADNLGFGILTKGIRHNVVHGQQQLDTCLFEL